MMNLHIVPDSKFINTFCANLEELGILENNKVIVATRKSIKYIERDLPHAPIYSPKFKELCGNTQKYKAVFIHLFSPLMYRWVTKNSFNELNWMVWGVDLYNLPSVNFDSYEDVTRNSYFSKGKSLMEKLYLLKVWITNSRFRNAAYAKVDHVLTWMTTEYVFAKSNLPSLRADHKFFFYENQMPYQKLDSVMSAFQRGSRTTPSIIVGNSGYATNNHLDVVDYIKRHHIQANLLIPVSYGDQHYITFLKRKLSSYTNGSVEFIDKYMNFDEYLNFLQKSDALVMNTTRPQGYGNVLMMLYLGKAVFLNRRNISLADLNSNGIRTNDWSEMNSILNINPPASNKEAISNLFSHSRLQTIYKDLFA